MGAKIFEKVVRVQRNLKIRIVHIMENENMKYKSITLQKNNGMYWIPIFRYDNYGNIYHIDTYGPSGGLIDRTVVHEGMSDDEFIDLVRTFGDDTTMLKRAFRRRHE